MDKVKNYLIGAFTAINIFLGGYFGVFTPLLWIVIVLMVLDLITRIYAAAVRTDDKPESKKVLVGVYRKLGMCFLIVLSMLLDFGLLQLAETLGITVVTKIIFTALTLAWIFVRELISNLENLQYAGVELPSFILSALDTAKDKVDQMSNAVMSNKKEDKR
jgi:toxin secretion/phage lysis holin